MAERAAMNASCPRRIGKTYKDVELYPLAIADYSEDREFSWGVLCNVTLQPIQKDIDMNRITVPRGRTIVPVVALLLLLGVSIVFCLVAREFGGCRLLSRFRGVAP
jgi:hypothetical protein